MSNKILLVLITFNCSLLTLNAQSQFLRTIGGSGYDGAGPIIQTTEGGYVLVGYTNSFGAGIYDMYIVKLDGSGTIQWSKTVGGPNNDFASSIIQTTDGGYALAGYTRSFGTGNTDMYITKLNGTGNLQWSRTVGGTSDDQANSIIQTTDGGYALSGSTGSFGAGGADMYIVKLDGSGTIQWSKTVGGPNNDFASSIIQTTDGGYVVVGETGGYDMYIVKLDGSGSLQWSKAVGGTNEEIAWSILKTTDGGYAVAGDTQSFGAGDYNMYIVKLDSSGNPQWSKIVGGFFLDRAHSIIQTTDGGYALAGETFSFGAGSDDMYIVKLDGSGTLQWSKTVGGTNLDGATSIIQTSDGGYAVAGYTRSYGAGNDDMYIVKLDGSGNTCGNSTSPPSQTGTGGTTTSPPSTVTTPPSTVTTSLSSVSTGGTVTTICTFVGIQPISNEVPGSYKLVQNYPNPFNPVTIIKFDIANESFVKLEVFDILGREVASVVNQELKAGKYRVSFDASKYSSGVYFYKLITNDFVDTKKMLLIK